MAAKECVDLDAALVSVPSELPLWIALSGGLDSVCLLRLCVESYQRLGAQGHRLPPLRAIHVNHQLQSSAIQFESFCLALCEQLGVELDVEHVEVVNKGEGVEAAAREVRYRCFASRLFQGGCLWMAHHRNDQAETFLLRIMRGSGLRGMAAMPGARPLGNGVLQRPLLNVRRSDLERLAAQRQWDWIEDPSNHSLEYSRNVIRQNVIPALADRWPNTVDVLASAADRLRESDELLNAYAAEDLARISEDPARLDVDALRALGGARAALVVRCALDCLGLPFPSRARLTTLIEQLEADSDRVTEVVWSGAVARCWRGVLYLMPSMTRISWSSNSDELFRRWLPQRENGESSMLSMMPRVGGERIRIGGMHRRLKTLLQERHVPPWEREMLVVVYSDEESEVVGVLAAEWCLLADGWRPKG